MKMENGGSLPATGPGSGIRSAVPGVSIALLLFSTACGDHPPEPGDPPTEAMEPREAFITVFFTRGEETVGVLRSLEEADSAPWYTEGPAGAPRSMEGTAQALEAALRELLMGPTPEEREDGISSWFSPETATSLRSVSVDDHGNVVVDFQDLAHSIPAASSSAGSTMLLAELNATVFQYPLVRSVEYRMGGSCDAFWNWLQYSCQVLTREDAGYPPGSFDTARYAPGTSGDAATRLHTGQPTGAIPGPTREPTPPPNLFWEPREAGLTSSLRGLSVVDSATVWVSGTEGRYALTRDGGVTWSSGAVPGAHALDFRDVEGFAGGIAYLMSAGPGPLSRIYKTTDWGATWTLQHGNELEDAFFNGFAFWDPEAGALVGDPLDGRMFLLLTEDGGRTWERPTGDRLPAFEPGEYGFAASGTNIATFGGGGLAVVSGGSAARVFLSQNRGQSWEVVSTPITAGAPSSGIFSIAFRSHSDALVVGGDYQEDRRTGENIAFSHDGGRTWTLAREPHGVGYRSGVAWREDELHPMWVAVGTSGSSFSMDGGRRWVTFDTTAYNTVAFAGPVGWAVGPEGRVARLRVE